MFFAVHSFGAVQRKWLSKTKLTFSQKLQNKIVKEKKQCRQGSYHKRRKQPRSQKRIYIENESNVKRKKKNKKESRTATTGRYRKRNGSRGKKVLF